MRDYEIDAFGMISSQGAHSKYLGVSRRIDNVWTASVNWCKKDGMNSSVTIACSDEKIAATVALVMYASKEFCDRMWHKMPTKIINCTNPINGASNSVITLDFERSSFVASRNDKSYLSTAYDFQVLHDGLVKSRGISVDVLKSLLAKLKAKHFRFNVDELIALERMV
jgi:hypothetical protein